MPSSWMLEKGIISRVVADKDLNQEADKIINRLAINAPLSLRAMKAVIIRELAFRDDIPHDDINQLVTVARSSKDAREGIAARLEKRTPFFTGE